jgi:hypothetical protein
MEEMLLEEEQEQIPVKSIDLDSLTIPDISTKKIDNKNDAMKTVPTTSIATTTTTITTTTAASSTAMTATTTTTTVVSSSLTPSPAKKPYTLIKVPHTNHMTPPLSSRRKKQTTKDSITTTTTGRSLNSFTLQ